MTDCGCDGDEFSALAMVEDDDEVPATPDPRGDKLTRWRGLLAPYSKPTGDKRRFAAGSLSNGELPVALRWQRLDGQGHSDAVAIGTVNGIEYTDEGVRGWGILLDPDPAVMPRLAEDVAEARHLMEHKVIGPSVDLDDMEFTVLGDELGELAAGDPHGGGRPDIEVTRGRIRAATTVQIPAFVEARPFELDEITTDEFAALNGMTAAAGVLEDLGLLAVTSEDIDGDDLDADTGLVFLFDDGDRQLFPVGADLDSESAELVPALVASAISVLAYHGDRVDLDEGSKAALRFQLGELAAACELPAPPWSQASLVASAGAQTKLPAVAFADPKLTGPTAPQFQDLGDGLTRCFGHIATWRTCHIGFQDRCVTAPRSKSNYAYFHVGAVDTEAGVLPTGKLTLGGGHADTRSGFQAAVAHYDDSSTAVADVVVGEDKHGIWYSGIVRPGLTQAALDELAAAPLSGDWRRIGGGLEMIAALAVNTPGFPIPRVREDRAGAFALVAAGSVYDPPDERVKANLAKKKTKKRPMPDGDNDDEHWSLDDVAEAVYGRFAAEERAQRETAVLAATLEDDLGALDQLQLAGFASVFE